MSDLTAPKAARSFGLPPSALRNHVPNSVLHFAGRRTSFGRALRVLLGAVLLTTCSTDTIGPGGRVVGVMQAGELIRAAAEFAIPIDQVTLEIRRASDDVVVFSQTIPASRFISDPDQLRIQIDLTLRARTEDFTFVATARSGGVDYYQATGSITAVAFETAASTPVIPVYIGPGANADGIAIPQATPLGNGESATLTALVTEAGTPISGVPVSFQSSDSSLLIPAQQSLNTASVTAPTTGTGQVTITARTPTNLSTTGTVDWAPRASALVLVSGNGQTANTNTAAAAPLVVAVQDPQGVGVPGTVVTFAVTAGPTGTSVAPLTAVSDAQGRAQTTLTAGSPGGAITVTASAAGLAGSPVTFTATAVTSVGVPATVTANTPVAQNAVVNTVVAAPPAVIVRDANGTAVPNVTVTFAITGGGGTLTGATQTTSSSGIATVGSWTVGTATGANTMTATVASLTPVTFTATGTAGAPATLTKVQGDSQTANSGAALPVQPTVLVRDQFQNPVPGVTVNWTPSDGTATPASGPTGANGQAATTWTLGAGQLAPTLTAGVVNLPSFVFHATTVFTSPTILLSTGGNPLVGVGLSTTVDVTLSQPAGINGANLSLSSDNTNTVTVGSPSLFIPQGGTTGSFQITGVSAGLTTIRATAAGYTAGALGITATLQIISLPATLNVPFGQNQNFPVSLAVAAPAGGVVVAIATSDATRVSVVSPTVSIPAGSQVGTATVFGAFPGPATLTGTAIGYVGASSAATTTASLNIVQSSATLNPTFGTTVTIELRSGATTIPAPSGGLVVNLAAGNPSCLSVPATVTIPQGLVNTTAPLTYGGTGAPCNTTLTASAPDIVSDQITVTVNALPGITLNTPGQFSGRLGAGLQDFAGGGLQVAPPVPVVVRLTSGDPTRVLLAPDATTPGTAFIDITVPNNTTSFSYYTQGVAPSTGPVTITASATGFSNGTTAVTVASPAIDLAQVSTTTTTLGTTDPFVIRVGVPNVNATAMQALQALTFGSSPVAIQVINRDPAVGKLVTTPLTADTVSVTLGLGVTQTPSTVASGGVAFDPQAAGTTSISATAPGFVALPSATASITVNQPNITLSTPAQFTGRVGVGLQDQGSGQLQNPTPVPTSVRLTSGDPTMFLLAPDATTPGAASVDIPIATGGQTFSYYIQGLAPSTGTVPITATAPGFNNGTVPVTIANSGIDIIGLGTAATSLGANTPFAVRIGVLGATPTFIQAEQAVRAGQPAVVTTLTSRDPAVGQLITLPDSLSPVSVTIPATASRSPSTVAAGGVAFDPINAGSTDITVSAPGFATVTASTVTVTVSAPNITLNTPAQFTGRLGNGLQDNASGSLQTAPGAPLTVRITASDTTVVKFAPNATTPGTGILDLALTASATSFTYVVQGFGTSPTPITITATATGYNAGSVPITVAQPALVLSGLTANPTTFSTTDPFQAQIGVPNAAATGMSAFQAIRAGGATVVVDLTNSNGTVAQLVTTPVTGNAVSVQIAAGQSSSPSSVATGGVAFDPLVAGSTTVAGTATGFIALPTATQVITVTAPTITLNTPGQFTGQVGAGLQDAASGNFQVATPGSLTVRIQSSNPGVALVSPNATTAGQSFIDIPIASGSGSFTYVIQGVEGQSGTVQISATAPGYSTGVVNVTIVAPALQISGLNTTYTAAAANDPFQVLVGIPNTNRTGMSAFQAIRTGGTALTVTIQNSNGTTGTLVTGVTPVSGNTATVSVQPGQSASPSTRATGGIEFDPLAVGTTSITATGAPFFALPTATVNVTVQ